VAKKRRGRPKKAGPRTRGGKLSRAYQPVAPDYGTKELQADKLGVLNGASDQALSSSLSGVLFAHGILDDRQLNPANRFRSARAACFGAVLADRDPNRPEITEKQPRRTSAGMPSCAPC
jgi:hypothetical protein